MRQGNSPKRLSSELDANDERNREDNESKLGNLLRKSSISSTANRRWHPFGCEQCQFIANMYRKESISLAEEIENIPDD